MARSQLQETTTFPTSWEIIFRTLLKRMRRLRNEGFGTYILSVTLLTVGISLITIYMHRRWILDEAVKDEIRRTVGSLQEPADTTKELGLIAYALGRLNSAEYFVKGSKVACPTPEPECQALLKLPYAFSAHWERLSRENRTNLNEPVPDSGLVDRLKSQLEPNPDRICIESPDEPRTYLVLPIQARERDEPYKKRVLEAIQVSEALGPAIADLLYSFGERTGGPSRIPKAQHFVQAYFISQDSVMRLWSAGRERPCEKLPPTRLWASKHYFSHFLDNPQDTSYLTRVYLDYGGNGLVRTICHVVPRKDGQRGTNTYRFLGIICADYRLPEGELQALHDQLFFETADIQFPFSLKHIPDQVAVSLSPRPSVTSGDEGDGDRRREDENRQAGMLAQQQRRRREDKPKDGFYLRQAVAMQSPQLTETEIEGGIHEALTRSDMASLERVITKVRFGGKTAFLLPMGITDGVFRGICFYPRNPSLKPHVQACAVFGLLFVGAAFALAIYDIVRRPLASQLREKRALFRNLQAGILRVNDQFWIEEANDRAEEMFGKLLPKPGVPSSAVNFQHLVKYFVKHEAPGDNLPVRSEDLVMLKWDDIAKARGLGMNSSYFAMIRGKWPEARWINVSATPMMSPTRGTGAAKQIELSGVFATIVETPPEIAAVLTAFVGKRP